MDGIKSEDLNSLSKDIWNWRCDKNIWLSAAHIPGKCNPAVMIESSYQRKGWKQITIFIRPRNTECIYYYCIRIWFP
jgi:hypothetical protein